MALLAGLVHRRAARADLLGGLLDRHVRARIDPARTFRPRPMHGVANHALDLWMTVRRINFVARAEVENLSVAALERAAAPEDFAALEPGEKHDLIGIRNREWLAVHLLVFD